MNIVGFQPTKVSSIKYERDNKMDMRSVCKIFLDFVYDEKILTKEIEDILNKHNFRGDFRKICRILQYNKNYYRGEESPFEQELIQAIKTSYCFNDPSICNWLKQSQVRLNNLCNDCNIFFHDVYDYKNADELFVDNIKDVIRLKIGKNNRYEKMLINLIDKNSDNEKIEGATSIMSGMLDVIENEKMNTVVEDDRVNGDEWTRTKAMDFCKSQGYLISVFYTLTSQSTNKNIKDICWANPSLKNLSNEWDIIINDRENRCFKILHIPANTFNKDDFEIKKNSGLPNMRINKETFLEERKNIDLSKYFVAKLDY